MTDAKVATNGQTPAESNGHVDLTGLRRIDPNKLKVRELVEIERQLDRRVAPDLMSGIYGADLMQALLWIALRRVHPATTFDAVGEVGFDEIVDRIGEDEPVEGDAVDPPTPPSDVGTDAGMPAPKSSKRSRASATSTG